ncbi:midcut-by-XrtH protein [Ottowia sp. VDI28]|uniref:midcut-by-XrtH protein n=1 Tax=Ottowia sp. VDI28 TaxID=3133968 RepID=UPI003C30DF59
MPTLSAGRHAGLGLSGLDRSNTGIGPNHHHRAHGRSRHSGFRAHRGFWMLALLVSLLAAAGSWAIRSGRAQRAARFFCGLVVLASGVMVASYNPSVRAALAPWMLSFTQAQGETMAIPILPSPSEGTPTDFAPVQFTNASSNKLRIAEITSPESPAVCFPAGPPGSLPTTPLPEGVPVCTVDLQLEKNASCVVDVAAMCAQGVAAISVLPQSLSFEATSTGILTVTSDPASLLTAQNVNVTIPGGSSLLVQSTTCSASLAPGASCTITLASLTAQASTDITIAGDNTNTVTAAVTVEQAPVSTYTVGGIISGLAAGESLVLQNNGADNLAQCSGDSSFTFSTPVAEGSPYNVTVLQQPAGQTCTVSNGSGVMNGANVTNVIVNCTADLGNTLAAKLQGWGC